MKQQRTSATTVLLAMASLVMAGCSKREPQAEHLSFATPDEAETAFIAAIEKDDIAQLKRLLGSVSDALLSSGDAVADHATRAQFLEKYRARHQFVAGGPDDLVLQVGEDDWPLPIPLVRQEGRWKFDGP